MSICKGCGAEILWVITDAGKRMPLSVASKQQRFIVKPNLRAGDIGTVVDTYLSHFADCPDANAFRKDKAG